MMVCTPLALDSTDLTVQGMMAGVRIDLNPILPMLILEDIEGHITLTDCSDSAIVVHFQDLSSFDAAIFAWSDEADFAVLTNHNDCQMVGEHGVRRLVRKNGHLHHAN